jgi:hypothetical protein
VNTSRIRLFEPGSQAKRGRFPGTARPKQHDELAAFDVQIKFAHGFNTAEALAYAFEC